MPLHRANMHIYLRDPYWFFSALLRFCLPIHAPCDVVWRNNILASYIIGVVVKGITLLIENYKKVFNQINFDLQG